MTTPDLAAIDCQNLSFAFAEGQKPVLDGISLDLKRGDRCLLVGANGGELTVAQKKLTSAGKSTFLRILAGKRLTKTRNCKILGQDVFMNPPGVSSDGFSVLTAGRGLPRH